MIYILQQRTKSEDLKLYCLEYLRATQSFAYTLTVLRELDASARKEIGLLGGNKGLLAILDRLRVDNYKEIIC